MKIEYDAAKNARNVRERGLSFERAAEFDFEAAITMEDRRREYGEIRYRSLGILDQRLHALVFTFRGESLRVISLRKANRKEGRLYAERTGSGND